MLARYNKYRCMDISNGPGIRVSIFFQGCHFHCKGCFNQDTWDFNGGKPFTEQVIDHIVDLVGQQHYQGLSILGGEPLHPYNIDAVVKLCKRCKEKYPEKDIWLWTGRLYENEKDNEILKYVDILIDGPFIQELSNKNLKYRGSENQRVLNISV